MKAVIIGASGEALHTIRTAKEQGLVVTAIDGNPEAAGLKEADEAFVINISDEEETIQAVKKIQPDSDKITQVDKIYYANATDGSLEDSYELADGPCTVKEAVEWAEEYENEKRPYKPGEGFRVRAANVRVFKLPEKRQSSVNSIIFYYFIIPCKTVIIRY